MMAKNYSDEEFYKLLNAASDAKQTPLKFALLISLGGRCGVRTTECCNIKLEDIDFEQELLWVTTLKQRGQKKGTRRFIPLDKDTVILLKTYIKQMNITKDESYLFKKRKEPHNPQTRSGIADMMTRLTIYASIPNRGFKGLRHFFCTNNAPHMQPQELAALTGHSNLNMIMIYYHANPEIIREKYDLAVGASKQRMKRAHPSYTK